MNATERETLARIERKLDWIHEYLTTRIAQPDRNIPAWPPAGRTCGFQCQGCGLTIAHGPECEAIVALHKNIHGLVINLANGRECG